MTSEAVIRRFAEPDERRSFDLGTFELLKLPGVTIGRAEYQPGWRWSEHVGQGQTSCPVSHVGMVLSGRNRVTMDDGRILDLEPGDVFVIGPGHDSWVVGDEPYVSLHLLGADTYASE
jgi:quercetin dioxygenase-like cupin family protein